MNKIHSDSLIAAAALSAGLAMSGAAAETLEAHGVYTVECRTPKPGMEAEHASMMTKLDRFQSAGNLALRYVPLFGKALLRMCQRKVGEIRDAAREFSDLRWSEPIVPNLVVTTGKNYLLDNGMAGSAYTAAFYLGLISSVGYTAVAAGDTMASHAGWTEAGTGPNFPLFSQVARPAVSWSAAAAGVKAIAASIVFNIITTGGTVQGAFLTTVTTLNGTTGTLFSGGVFSGGAKVVAPGDTLNVSYSLSV